MAMTAAANDTMKTGFGSFPLGTYGMEFHDVSFNAGVAGDTVALTSKYGKRKIIGVVGAGPCTFALSPDKFTATLTLRATVGGATDKITVMLIVEPGR